MQMTEICKTEIVIKPLSPFLPLLIVHAQSKLWENQKKRGPNGNKVDDLYIRRIHCGKYQTETLEMEDGFVVENQIKSNGHPSTPFYKL